MPIEVGVTRVADLNPQWPRDSEIVAEGAAHLRTIKQALRSEGSALIGEIKMWYGAINEIPPGFALCNGQNGTPDMRGRFPVGAGATYELGDTGGNNTVALSSSQMPAHKHVILEAGVHDHTAETGNAGEHAHAASSSNAGTHTHNITVNTAGAHSHTGNTSAAGGHSHSASTGTAGSHNHSGTANTAGGHRHTLFMGGGSSGPRQRLSVDTTGHPSDYVGTNNSTEWDGSHSHSLSINNSGNHSHSVSVSSVGNHTHSLNIDQGGAHDHSAGSASAGNHTHSITVEDAGTHLHSIAEDGGHVHEMEETGGGTGHENRPPFRAVYFIMRIDI